MENFSMNNTMETKRCIIPEDTCLDVRAAQAEYENFRGQLASIIESHCLDLEDTVTDTPLFHGLVTQAAGAKKLWEDAKGHMIAPVEKEELAQGKQVVDWSLEFESGKLVYQTVPAQADRSGFANVMEVPAEVCNDIQKSHSVYDALTDTVDYLVSTHTGDTVDKITPSPVYHAFQKIIKEAMLEFDDKKEKMLKETFSKTEKAKLANWSLDYGKCELRYTFR